MARQPRNFIPNTPYHITSRSLNRESIFLLEEDFEKLTFLINDISEKSKNPVFGACIMNDHFHLLTSQSAEPGAWTISKTMQQFKKRFTVWYNKRHDRGGTLYQERFHATLIKDDRQMIECLRYIHNNPVKAGMEKEAADYKQSSYSDYITALKSLDENGEFPEKTGFTSCRKLLNIMKENGIDFVEYTNETNENFQHGKAYAERAARTESAANISSEAESSAVAEFKFFDYYERKQYRCDTKIADVLYKTYKINAHAVLGQPYETKRQIIDYMRFDENVSLKQLSRVFGITVHNLNRIMHGVNVTTVYPAETQKKSKTMSSEVSEGIVSLRL